MSSIYSIGQMNQLADKLEAEGFTPDEITKLGQFKNLSGIRGLFREMHEIKRVKHLIDCDTDPFRPDGWEVERHNRMGQLEWDVSRSELYLSYKQKDGRHIDGNKLCKELEGKPVLNANVLDYLLKNPQLIPEEWKDKWVFFWGSIYRDSDGNLVVRYLCWSDGDWNWYHDWLNDVFDGSGPAVLLAS